MNGEDHQHLDDETVLDYALEGLEGERRALAEAHLADCPYCRDMVRETMDLHDGFAGLSPETPAPASLADAILERVRQLP